MLETNGSKQYKVATPCITVTEHYSVESDLYRISLGKKTLKSCQRDSSFHSELCFDSEIRLAFENIFYSERVAVQSYPDLNDDAYSD